MFHSIRWRLVASYVLLTLLTVGLMAVMGLSLIRNQSTQREIDHLTANASAVAHEAAPVMQSPFRRQSLQELAQTAAFLSNAQVRIMNSEGNVLANSGPRGQIDELVWIAPPAGLSLGIGPDGELLGPVIMALPGSSSAANPNLTVEGIFLMQDLPPGTEYTFVQQFMDMWGGRLAFQRGHMVGPGLMEQMHGANAGANGVESGVESGQDGELAARPVVTQPIGAAARPAGFVEMRSNLDVGAQALTTTRQAFVLAGLGATILALLLGLLVSQGLAAPLSRLTAAAGRMSSGDLSVRAPVQGRDEIGQLARQFNLMAQRLEISFAELAAERDTLRRFIADASHELRTPITALKSFNELMQGPAADDAEAQAEFLAESQGQIDRLEWITNNLLNLSRLEAGLVHLDIARHDVSDLLEAAAMPMRPLAEERGVALRVERPAQSFQLSCDRQRLELVLSNLLDNALKFTPPGGHIWLNAGQTDNAIRLGVKDDGLGIPLGEQTRIFERFFQGCQGNQVEGGSGLGLAIAQSIVQAHGGAIRVTSQPGQGSEFTIELPQERPASPD